LALALAAAEPPRPCAPDAALATRPPCWRRHAPPAAEGIDVAVGVDAVDAVAVAAASLALVAPLRLPPCSRLPRAGPCPGLGPAPGGAALLLDAEGGHEVAHVVFFQLFPAAALQAGGRVIAP
jgi:hypothetical protein